MLKPIALDQMEVQRLSSGFHRPKPLSDPVIDTSVALDPLQMAGIAAVLHGGEMPGGMYVC